MIMINKKILTLIIFFVLVILGGIIFFTYRQQLQPCNAMVSLAPGATLKAVCEHWATQSAQYKQMTRICGCESY